jgi:cellobiose-specific phosphotransferase system component IIA
MTFFVPGLKTSPVVYGGKANTHRKGQRMRKYITIILFMFTLLPALMSKEIRAEAVKENRTAVQLGQAVKSLRHAIENYTEGKPESAREDLKQAKSHFEEANKYLGEEIKNEAGKMLKEMEALEERLEKVGDELDVDLKSLTQRAEAFLEWDAQIASTGWEKRKIENKSKTDLINSQLHVAYAEVYQCTEGRHAKAKAEIDEAVRYLVKAREFVGDADKVRISAIEKELRSVPHLDETNTAGKARFEKIKNELRDMIRGIN